MRDEQKTKEELLKEIKVLRRNLEQFEQAEHIKKDLRESEHLFRNIFENATDGMLLADINTKKFYMCNNIIYQMLGIDQEEISDLGIMDVHPEQDLPYVLEQFEKQVKGELSLAKDIPVKRINGSVFYADINAFPISIDGKTYLMGIFRDVSERKKTEEDLRDSKYLLEKMFSSLDSAVFVLDNSKPPCIVDCNPATLNIFGYPRNQMIGQTTDILHVNEDSHSEFLDMLRSALETQGHLSSFEFRMKRSDGEIFPTEHSVRQLKNDKGDRIGWVSVISDITERKKAESALKQSEEKFRLAMEAANNALWDWNMVTNEVYRNPFHATMLGYEPHELTTSQDEWEKRVHPEDKQLVFQMLEEHLSGKRDHIEVEYRLRTKSDNYIWVLGRSKIVAYSDDGSPARMIGTNIDITSRKKAEKVKTEYQTLIQGIMDNIGAIVVVRDCQGKYLLINKEVEKVLGMESEQIIGKTPFDIHSNDKANKILEDDKRIIENRTPLVIEDMLDVKGETRIFLGTKFPLLNEAGEPYAVCTLAGDITERKKAENALRESETRYRTLVEQLPAVTYTASLDDISTTLYVSPQIKDLIGFTVEEYKSDPDLWRKRLHANDRDRVLKTVSQSHAENMPFVQEYRMIAKNGNIVWFRDEAVIVKDEKNRPLFLQGVMYDITDRKYADEEVRKFKTIADKAGHGVGIADLQGNLVYVNDSFAQMHQYSPDELIGKSLSIFHEEEQIERVSQLNDKLKQKGSYVAEEVWHKKRDNSIFPTLMSGTLVKDERGEPLFMAATAIDMTKHRKAEDALQESELRYRTLFETLPVGIGLTTLDGRIFDANSIIQRMLGRSLEELIQINVRDLYHNPDKRIGLLKQLQQDGLIRDLEMQLRRKNGTTFYANLNVTAIQIRDETVLVTVTRDITEQRNIEKALAESEEKYRTVVESTRDPIATFDDAGVILFANREAAESLGYQPGDLTGKAMWDIFPKEIADRQVAHVRQAIETGQRINTVSLSYIRGKPRWYNTTIEPLRNDRGRTTSAMIIARDVDDIKRAEEQIQKLSSAIEASISGIAMGDVEGNLTYVNHALLEMWGFNNENEVLGRNAIEFWQSRDEGQMILETVINKGSWIGEMTAQKKDGSTFDVQVCATLVKDESGKPISMIGSFVDISEMKRKEDELSRYRGQMARAEQLASLGTLSATVAHQLTQPLTVIRLSMDNALDELEATSSSQNVIKRLKDSVTQVSNITSIIDRFRNFARKSSGRTVAEVNLKSVALRITSLLSESASSARIILRIKNMDDLLCSWISENDLEQLFFALIENAIQAADGKKTRQLIISAAVKDEHIELRISDDCDGIAPENIDKIFEPFFTTKPRGQGTGLGLCIVQDVVSRNGGRIKVESEFGKGTMFTIRLPFG